MDFYFVTFLSLMTNNFINPNTFKKFPCSIEIVTTGNSQTLALCDKPPLNSMDTYSVDEILDFFNILDKQVEHLINTIGDWDLEAKNMLKILMLCQAI